MTSPNRHMEKQPMYNCYNGYMVDNNNKNKCVLCVGLAGDAAKPPVVRTPAKHSHGDCPARHGYLFMN